MTDQLRLYALPGDIVQLSGRNKIGKVLDWSKQLPMDRRDHEATHYPIGSVDADVESRAEKFWPLMQVTMIKRATIVRKHDPFDEPIRF